MERFLVLIHRLSLVTIFIFSYSLAANEHISNIHVQKVHKCGSEGMHAKHRAALANKVYRISEEAYKVSNTELLDSLGHKRELRELVGGDKPIALNFIFTTCTTICPVMTATFSQVQKELGPEAKDVRFISITIDPEHDRPKVLNSYAENFRGDAEWYFLTGSTRNIEIASKSLNAYTGSKMNHKPLTLLKAKENNNWIRIDGLASASVLTKIIKTRLLD